MTYSLDRDIRSKIQKQHTNQNLSEQARQQEKAFNNKLSQELSMQAGDDESQNAKYEKPHYFIGARTNNPNKGTLQFSSKQHAK